MNNILAEVRQLKEHAKISRDRASKDPGRLEIAIEDIDEAIQLLNDEAAHTEDDNYMATLRRELADCYGMMGGIYRRKSLQDNPTENLKKSLNMYEKGKVYETDSSYNLSNTIVISILIDPKNLEMQQSTILDGIKTIQEQVRGKRGDQWWAWADLGLFNVLAGYNKAAFDAYEHFTLLGARTKDYETTISVLLQLRERLKGAEFKSSKEVSQLIEDVCEFLLSKKPEPEGAFWR